MLIDLHMKDVGPADEMSIAFKPRMNFITGDNGLGKSFLLDVAWWALTRTWARGLIVPHRPPSEPRLSYSYTKTTSDPFRYTSTYDREAEHWSVKQGRPPIPGMVLYAQVDGGFSVWDPVRNSWKSKNDDHNRDRPPAYFFDPRQVWYGSPLCEGLIRDWASWQREDGEAFAQLTQVLAALSPGRPIRPGPLRRVFVTDPKDYPTIQMPYGREEPVVHASAGMQRIIALAYLLVWAWQEHERIRGVTGTPAAREIIFLIDEIESHLHPQWQRRIVPALLDVMTALTGQANIPIQLITVTHSPLVLASAEPAFDPDRDAIWMLDLDADHDVALTEYAGRPRLGGAENWLTSDVFDLSATTSVDAERAMDRADALIDSPDPAPADIEAADAELKRTLGDIDPYWVEWTAWRKKQQTRP